MYTSRLFTKFCKERNVRKSTKKGYESALKNYTRYHNQTIEELIQEAQLDEKNKIILKDRKIKNRLLKYRSYLLTSNKSPNTIKTYFTRVKTFYSHFEIEIPKLPDAKYDTIYETNYMDLPTKEDIRKVLDLVTVDLRSIILFMSSSGTAKAETLSITVAQFIDACNDYHNGGSITHILETLSKKNNIVPTFYLKRIKTDKYYYTFCSPEAASEIVRYLQVRDDLEVDDPLFDFSPGTLLTRFQEINDQLEWGFKGRYRYFRSHTLRKFHASNIGLPAEYIDSLQGRSKNEIHETYIKTNPTRLKEIYTSAMHNVMINNVPGEEVIHQEFTIVINVFLSGKEYNIL